MILTLDVGNSQIHGGVFTEEKGELKTQFRTTTRKTGQSSDDFGVFLRAVLRENGIRPEEIRRVSICSVVPDLNHSLRSCSVKYFEREPFFLQAGAKTGLNIRYRNAQEVGADRIANSIAGTHLFAGENLVIVDFGTATTLCAVSAEKDYLGGVILTGLRLAMEALFVGTAKLPKVEIVRPKHVLGRSTIESIQSGLFFGSLGSIRGLIEGLKEEVFGKKPVRVIGTGGFGRLFQKEALFDLYVPELVLKGLYFAVKMNQ